jgi:hypothetical protein
VNSLLGRVEFKLMHLNKLVDRSADHSLQVDDLPMPLFPLASRGHPSKKLCMLFGK